MSNTLYIGILIAIVFVVFFGDIKLSDSLYKTKRRLADKGNKIKKFLIPLFLFFAIIPAGAQNIQVLTNTKINFVTLEHYKPLNHGALYYFTDFKIDHNGYNESYTEISGYVNIYKTLSVTAQYNAGVNRTFTIYPVYLCGVSKSFTIGESFNLSVDLLFRHQNFIYLPDNEKYNGYQITAVFSQDFPKVFISGYCDFWDTKYYILEPQAFYKVFNNLWAGIEWRAGIQL